MNNGIFGARARIKTNRTIDAVLQTTALLPTLFGLLSVIMFSKLKQRYRRKHALLESARQGLRAPRLRR
ncbi:MAG: hypothetical protein U0105_28020 [Candidatus Obscuribacterales bacterium]